MIENILTFLSFSAINVSFCFLSFIDIRNKRKILLLSFLPYILTLMFHGYAGSINPKEHIVYLGTVACVFIYLRIFYFIIPYSERFFLPIANPETVKKFYQYLMIIMALFFTLIAEYAVGDWIFNSESFKEIWG